MVDVDDTEANFTISIGEVPPVKPTVWWYVPAAVVAAGTAIGGVIALKGRKEEEK